MRSHSQAGRFLARLLSAGRLILVLWFAAGTVRAERYALLVGIDCYDGIRSLPSCVNDANGIRRCLLQDAGRWKTWNVTTRTDESASWTAVRAGLQGLASTAQSGDLVLFFFSGHGGQHSGTDTYICCTDYDYEDYELASDLAGFRAGVTVVIVIDACHSGGMPPLAVQSLDAPGAGWEFAHNVMRKFAAAPKTQAAETGASICWITACRYDETSLAGLSYSLFAGFIVHGFAFGDANADGAVSFQELFDYAAPKTVLADSTQNPLVLHSNVLSATAAAVSPSDTTVQDAIDNVALPVVTIAGPDARWYRQTSQTHDLTDAARSGTVTHGHASELVSRVDGPGTLRYWWRVSSEADYDFLCLSVDDMLAAQISGTTAGWAQKTIRVRPGKHLIRWSYVKDGTDLGYTGSDCGWVDQVEWIPDAGIAGTELAEAVDDGLLPVRKGGDQPWALQTSTTHDGMDGAESGIVPHGGCSWFSTSVVGPGTLSYWWKVSSQQDDYGCDVLEFAVDGEGRCRLAGDVDWRQSSECIGPGVHSVTWSYVKDCGGSSLSDKAWVDQVIWTGESDTDGDGLPTRWEEEKGLSPNDGTGSNGADGDPDGDGVSNRDEYRGDTDPMSRASTLAFTGICATGSIVHLAWQGGMRARQWLERSPDPRFGWTRIRTNEPPTATRAGYADTTATNACAFYRLRAERTTSASVPRLIHPNAPGIQWCRGRSYDIVWEGLPGASVKIEWSHGGTLGWMTLASSAPNIGSYSWIVPGYWDTRSDYNVRVTSTSQPSASSQSACCFEVVGGARITLPEAVDMTNWVFTTGGIADWFGQATTTFFGADAAQSGTVGHNQETWMCATAAGPGTVTFYWKVSSESYCDCLEFQVDGVRQDRVSGSVDWTRKPFAVPAGLHVLKWLYTKDGSVSDGSDCGWVDKVEWVPATVPPTVTYPSLPGILWRWGYSYTITWQDFPGTYVKIELYKGGLLNRTISASAANDGSYSWTVPTGALVGTDFRVKIASLSDSSKYDYSNYNFQIFP